MPSSFSTPDDKSIPKGFISLRICLILLVFIPPDKNHGFFVSRFFSILVGIMMIISFILVNDFD